MAVIECQLGISLLAGSWIRFMFLQASLNMALVIEEFELARELMQKVPSPAPAGPFKN